MASTGLVRTGGSGAAETRHPARTWSSRLVIADQGRRIRLYTRLDVKSGCNLQVGRVSSAYGLVRQKPGRGLFVGIALLLAALGGLLYVVTSGGSETPGSGPTTSGCRATDATVAVWASFGRGGWPGGCWRPYADTSPYNQRLPAPSATPLDPNSAKIVRFMLTAYGAAGFADVTTSNRAIHDTPSVWSSPVYWAHVGDPAYRVSEIEYPGNNQGATILIPKGARPSFGSDRHLAVIQPNGIEEDFWQVANRKPLTDGGVLVASAGGATFLGGSGCCTNSTAANQGLAAGQIRGQELQAGAIQHALVVTVKCDNGGHVYPATGNGVHCPTTVDAPAEGQRFQLNMTDAEVDRLPIPTYRKVIAKAMIHYGFYITDTGGSPWDLAFQPALDYTTFDDPNPLVTYVHHAGLSNADTYTLTFNQGIDWSKLQVVNVCYTRRTC